MKNYLNKIITSIKNIYYYSNSEHLIKYLRLEGFSIGKNFQLFAPKSICLDSKEQFSSFTELDIYLKNQLKYDR